MDILKKTVMTASPGVVGRRSGNLLSRPQNRDTIRSPAKEFNATSDQKGYRQVARGN